ncbi:NAD(P)H-dependent glycerol-3-phosphate dehydrogenase [Rhizobium sp. RU20A]|uniref:NAD(P)H-dependent glycerol-3-phosphate dehydrogenase n=1 Tax=Rhizobium sp. RU20A TaxID=1907412 RepID=UPI00122CCA45|nr:NAD(P)H-dependent glycerol-3-phosphate dehydrogenase [Rhizobium sp. RU20A]
MVPRDDIVVIGSGAFGTALASVAALTGRAPVTLLCRRPEVADTLTDSRLNERALPGTRLPDALAVSSDPAVLGRAGTVLFAMPSQAHAEAASVYGPYLRPGSVIVTCAKGLEKTTSRLLTAVLEAGLPGHPVAALSGPGFAADIARGLPTAMVVAAEEARLAASLAVALSGPTFRLYASTDRIGVQLGGALKNVLAIACGIVEGAGLGESARAALISRGLAELSRFVAAEGGEAETVSGLSGLGDLVLTGTSHQSRNLRFGIALGRGRGASASGGDLVEGAFTASVAAAAARRLGIDLPITAAVADIIEGRLDVRTALEQLMSRPIREE